MTELETTSVEYRRSRVKEKRESQVVNSVLRELEEKKEETRVANTYKMKMGQGTSWIFTSLF